MSRTPKTHCIHGHPLEGDNLWWRPDTGGGGQRVLIRACRACKRERERRSQQRRRGKIAQEKQVMVANREGWTDIDQDKTHSHYCRDGKSLCGQYSIMGLYVLAPSTLGLLPPCDACHQNLNNDRSE